MAALEDILDAGHVEMADYQKAGLFTELKYKSSFSSPFFESAGRDEVVEMLKERLKMKNKKSKLKRVSLRRYKDVSPSAFGLNKGRKVIAIVRASGAISSSTNAISSSEPSINAKAVIRDLRKAADRKDVVAIVLRIDSPGGEALASDLMWHEIKRISKEKPVVASMADLAASGGYYMAMGARKIVAESLTLTGSIGVVLSKFSLGELYKKIGYVTLTASLM